jgi:hypothetical protein
MHNLIMIAQTLVIATLFTIIFFSEPGHMLNQFLKFQSSLQNNFLTSQLLKMLNKAVKILSISHKK